MILATTTMPHTQMKATVLSSDHSAMAITVLSTLWMLMEAEFLSITLVLVYVGAVMVLFLFVVMMLDINISEVREGFVSYLPVGFMIGLVILLEIPSF